MKILIVAPAKSGSTILLHALAGTEASSRIYDEEPVSSLRDLPANCVAKVIYENESEEAILQIAPQFDLKILLVRDPRDNLLSRLLYRIAGLPQYLGDDKFLRQFIAALIAKRTAPGAHSLQEISALFADDPVFGDINCARLERFATFVRQHRSDWSVVYYEDMVAGNLRGLQMATQRSISLPTLPANLSRVARSKRSGDWKHWYTASDVALLQDRLTPLLTALGYNQDWTPAEQAQIEAAHAEDYVRRLIVERRKHFDLPAWNEHAGLHTDTSAPRCNICGGTEFVPGPFGRMTETGKPPHCTGCDALERQRIVRGLFQALPLGFIDWRRGLQFSPDPGVCAEQFRSYEVSVYGGENSLDMQALKKEDGSYDFISFNHVLEFIPDDRQAFREVLRVLSPNGIVQACFSQPLNRAKSEDFATPFGPHEAWHLYGTDFAERFELAQEKVGMLVVEAADPCTGAREVVHFFCKNISDTTRIALWLQAWHADVRIIPHTAR